MCALPLVVFVVGSVMPALCVLVRRLHDTGRSGAWVWLFIPLAAISDFILGALQYSSDHRMENGLGDDWSVDTALVICQLAALLPELPWLIIMCRRSAPGANRYGEMPEVGSAVKEALPDFDAGEALKKAAQGSVQD
ncbi:MAG: DUF805 domain-containing protein [Succinivibrio sp.]|nr:DUF805 domain-containing protein [Succinivibrio sp.]